MVAAKYHSQDVQNSRLFQSSERHDPKHARFGATFRRLNYTGQALCNFRTPSAINFCRTTQGCRVLEKNVSANPTTLNTVAASRPIYQSQTAAHIVALMAVEELLNA